MKVTFEPGAAKHVIECFGKTLDEDGYIIDEVTHERVDYRGEEIHIDDLAMVEDGSDIFVDDSFGSLVDHIERNRPRE